MRFTLLHKPTQHRVENISPEEAKTLLKVLPVALRSEWFIQKDANSIAPLSFAFFGEPDPNAVDQTMEVEIDKDRSDQRQQMRYRRGFTFIAQHNGNVFQAETVDLNLKGVQLQESLPGAFPLQFQATLAFEDGKRVTIMVKRLKDPKNVKLMILNIDNQDILKRWLLR